jgi:formate dehydrogenase subunit delta
MSLPAEARMGNDIARQLAHLPVEEAVEAVARHIETFWDPRMRRSLEALASASDPSLDPLLAAAADRLSGHTPRRAAELTRPRTGPPAGP